MLRGGCFGQWHQGQLEPGSLCSLCGSQSFQWQGSRFLSSLMDKKREDLLHSWTALFLKFIFAVDSVFVLIWNGNQAGDEKEKFYPQLLGLMCPGPQQKPERRPTVRCRMRRLASNVGRFEPSLRGGGRAAFLTGDLATCLWATRWCQAILLRRDWRWAFYCGVCHSCGIVQFRLTR